MKMMEAFKEGRTLNIRYAWPLIKQAKDIFSKESTVQVRFAEGVCVIQERSEPSALTVRSVLSSVCKKRR